MRLEVPAVQYVDSTAPSPRPSSLLRLPPLDQKMNERNRQLVETNCHSKPSPHRPPLRQTNTAEHCLSPYLPMTHPGPHLPNRPLRGRLLYLNVRTPTKIASKSPDLRLVHLSRSLRVIRVLRGPLGHDQARDQHRLALASRSIATLAARVAILLPLPLQLLRRKYRSRVAVASSLISAPLFSDRRRTT